jgi:hypothetical protein
MAVKPLDWISWREARDRMPEIWDGWRYQLAHAVRAMVNALRRGHVPHRGEAWTPGSRYTRQPIALRDVVAGLLSLRLLSSFTAEAEYEATEWRSVLVRHRRCRPTGHETPLSSRGADRRRCDLAVA